MPLLTNALRSFLRCFLASANRRKAHVSLFIPNRPQNQTTLDHRPFATYHVANHTAQARAERSRRRPLAQPASNHGPFEYIQMVRGPWSS